MFVDNDSVTGHQKTKIGEKKKKDRKMAQWQVSGVSAADTVSLWRRGLKIEQNRAEE